MIQSRKVECIALLRLYCVSKCLLSEILLRGELAQRFEAYRYFAAYDVRQPCDTKTFQVSIAALMILGQAGRQSMLKSQATTLWL